MKARRCRARLIACTGRLPRRATGCPSHRFPKSPMKSACANRQSAAKAMTCPIQPNRWAVAGNAMPVCTQQLRGQRTQGGRRLFAAKAEQVAAAQTPPPAHGGRVDDGGQGLSQLAKFFAVSPYFAERRRHSSPAIVKWQLSRYRQT